MTHKFLELIYAQTLLADGAMGTILHAHSVGFDRCFDELNLTSPGAVAEIQRAYITPISVLPQEEIPAYQLIPEQSTAAIIVHHPQARYYSVGESSVEQLMRSQR